MSKFLIKDELEIISRWKVDNTIKISIICTAFNHEDYIEDAICSFLSQETSFPFEIIIHDDSSLDNTQSIIKKYLYLYPNIIKCIFQKHNQYSINVNLPLNNAFSISTGDYIAFCEGDDYWCNTQKLQKQIDILEKNNEIGMVVTDYNVLYDSNKLFKHNLMKNNLQYFNSKLQYEEFLTEPCYMAPPSWVMRRKFFYNTKKTCLDGTFVWFLDILKETKVYLMEETCVVRRVLDESASYSNDINKMLVRQQNIYETQRSLIEENNLSIDLYQKVEVNNLARIIDIYLDRNLSISDIFHFSKNIKKKEFFKLKLKSKLKFIYIIMPFSSEIRKCMKMMK